MQDAHEFLNYLLNQACEILEEEEKRKRGGAALPTGMPPPTTWVHDIFQGKLVNETRCLQVWGGIMYLCLFILYRFMNVTFHFLPHHQCP